MTNTISILDLKKRNQQAGEHFFSDSTMRFFNSIVETEGIAHGEQVWFVTSEQDDNVWDGLRRYTIRKMHRNGTVDSVSEFGEYHTLEEAQTAMYRATK